MKEEWGNSNIPYRQALLTLLYIHACAGCLRRSYLLFLFDRHLVWSVLKALHLYRYFGSYCINTGVVAAEFTCSRPDRLDKPVFNLTTPTHYEEIARQFEL